MSNKPWFFIPFIIVYKIVFFILLLPIKICKIATELILMVCVSLYHSFDKILSYFIILCLSLFKLFKYIIKNLIKLFVLFIIACFNILKRLILFLKKILVQFIMLWVTLFRRLMFCFIKVCVFIYKIFVYLFTFISHLFYKILCYFKLGFIVVSLIIKDIIFKTFYHFFYAFYSIAYFVKSIGIIIYYNFKSYNDKRKYDNYEKYLLKKKAKEELEKQKKEELRAKLEQEEILRRKKEQEEAELNKSLEQNVANANVKSASALLRKTKFEKFNEWLKSQFTFSSFNNKKYTNMQPLIIDFEGADAVKSDKKILYEYIAKDRNGEIVKDYFEAFSKVEVHSFLLSEGYEVYSIKTSKWITLMHGQTSSNGTKIKTKDLLFFITQLSTYIKAGIPLAEAMSILSRQYKKKSYKKIFSSIVYSLSIGEAFSSALAKQGKAFPKLFINMVKTSEMTGELPETLDDMADYYTEMDKTRKQMITALMYPTMVMFFAIGVIIFILVWVIPKFVKIYESMDASKIPAFTLFVMDVSDFLKNYGIIVLLGIVVAVLILVYLYKNIKSVRKNMQWFAMHLPVFGNVIIYNEVTMFTKTFASLLKHNVFITDSMEILNRITNNEIYKILILNTTSNIAKGEKISLAFKDHWAFPIPAYEMLVTGEKTGQLPDMMAKVSAYYQDMHAQSVARIKTFIEPVLIIFLTVVVGAIILAIILPMFGMYEMIQ